MAPPEGMRMKNEREYPAWTKDIMKKLRYHNINTYRHSVRVGFIAYSLWKDLIETTHDIRLRPQINNILIAGFVHDCGKLNVSKKILDNAGQLSHVEKEIISWHPHMGAAMIYHHDRDIADMVRGHHRWGTKFAYIAYPPYFADPFAREEIENDNYPIVRKAQIMLAIADKADVVINRVNGLGGGGVQPEIGKFSERFEEEINRGDVTEDMLKKALQYAVQAGEYQQKYWGDF